jgi:hypothetical protein
MHRRLNNFELDLLKVTARYRYIDSKHWRLLTGQTNKNFDKRVQRLVSAKLVGRLDNNNFKRDRLKDAYVYEITNKGVALLSQLGITVKKATWLKGGVNPNPVHNLDVCLFVASAEIFYKSIGYPFFAWEEILERAPEKTRKLEKPYVLQGLVPDAMYAVEFPDDFALFTVEIDLTNHGKADYEEKYGRYADIIFKGSYKEHLSVTMKMFVQTVCTNVRHLTETVLPAMPERKPSPFLFKVHPPYGSFNVAPPPAPQLFAEEWHRANQPPTTIGALIGHTTTT